MGLIVILIAAWAITKAITNYKLDREYARQGLASPRTQMKIAKARSGEASPAAVARSRPGASGYFRELWDDAWDDALQRHRQRKAAKEAGTAPPRRHRKPWRQWLYDPIGEADDPKPPVREPKPTTPPPAAPTAPANTRATTPDPLPPAPPSPPVTNQPPQDPPRIPCPRGCGGRIVSFRTNPFHPEQGTDQYCNKCGWLTEHAVTPNPDKQGDDMAENTATGDVHDVESCDQELGALTDDLTAIDTALDVIDENVRSARTSAELIQAFLAGKNVDGDVLAGLAQSLDMLGPDAIKNLIDSIAAAKAGVEATKEAMGPLREASELVGAADGSVLNGR